MYAYLYFTSCRQLNVCGKNEAWARRTHVEERVKLDAAASIPSSPVAVVNIGLLFGPYLEWTNWLLAKYLLAR